jgi:hypothetical protein
MESTAGEQLIGSKIPTVLQKIRQSSVSNGVAMAR